MKEFAVKQKIFVKSNNSTRKILLRYMYSLFAFIIGTIILNLFAKNYDTIFNLIKTIILSLTFSIIIDYIINIVNKKYNFKKLFTEDNIISISIIIALFGINTNILILFIATFISLIIKKIYKGINISASLYGVLFILIYKYLQDDLVTPLTNLKTLGYIDDYKIVLGSNNSIITYILGKHYLSPVISIIIFIYLFYKKSIKYNLVISYIATFSLIMLIFGIFTNMNIWYCFFQLTTGNILFLSVFCLTDYRITPETNYGQIIYGIILGIITFILRFIVPELSVIITLIIGPILFTKLIDKLSIKRYVKDSQDKNMLNI